jgi:hypothetical protein
VESEIFLQRGLDTPVNKPPDGQITGPAGSNTSHHLAHRTRNFETKHSPPVPWRARTSLGLRFIPTTPRSAASSPLASRRRDVVQANRIVVSRRVYGIVEEWTKGVRQERGTFPETRC